MKEFRLVIYMNAADSRNFWGGRGAASPLAYACHLLNGKRKVFLGGKVVLQGLGKYHSFLEDALDETSEPLKLPSLIQCGRERIRISDIAFIYQNDDPLLTTSKSGIYWEATIDALGRRESFSGEDRRKFTLDAVKIGLEADGGRDDETRLKREKRLVVLASRLRKLAHPLDKDNSPGLLVYGGSSRERRFWGDNGKPTIPRVNAFVHMMDRERRKYDTSAKAKPLNFPRLIDGQIKNNHINESLVHEMLKILFASEGWWVNYELPVPIKDKTRGRIDFLIKRSPEDDWRLIEVKLDDNPDAVAQLHEYIKAIRRDVKMNEDSFFWPLHVGRKGCKPIRGVVLCAAPGGDTVKEVQNCRVPYDVWTYSYKVRRSKLGIEVRDARTWKLILQTPRD